MRLKRQQGKTEVQRTIEGTFPPEDNVRKAEEDTAILPAPHLVEESGGKANQVRKAIAPSASGPEAWLQGPLIDVRPMLTPAAHALLQAAVDIEQTATALSAEELWCKPGGAPSVGFHLRHISGSIDRLLTYAAGRQLNEEQFQALAVESWPGIPAEEAVTLVQTVAGRIEEALKTLRSTPDESLFEQRVVGRAKLPSTVFGLLFHIAEHTQRHTGQIVTTTRVMRGLSAANYKVIAEE